VENTASLRIETYEMMIAYKRSVRSPCRLRTLLFLVGVSTSLSGCLTHTRDNNGVMASTPSDYRERHPIVIEEANRSVEIFIGNGRGGLTEIQRSDVIGLGQAWLREGTGRINIDVPAGTPNARAATDSQQEILSLFTTMSVPANAIVIRNYHPRDPRQLATIRMSYPRIVAEAGPCGLWPEDIGPSIKNRGYVENKPYHNFGCATQRNLAAMIDNPSDLVQPRAETPAYTARRAIAFEKYRKGEATSTTYPDAEKAKLSDTGK
jgi:pilus assembly protein CpaD